MGWTNLFMWICKFVNLKIYALKASKASLFLFSFVRLCRTPFAIGDHPEGVKGYRCVAFAVGDPLWGKKAILCFLLPKAIQRFFRRRRSFASSMHRRLPKVIKIRSPLSPSPKVTGDHPVPQRGKGVKGYFDAYPVPLRLWRRTYPSGVQVHRGKGWSPMAKGDYRRITDGFMNQRFGGLQIY